MMCEGHGSHLVDIKTEAEMTFLRSLYQSNFAASDREYSITYYHYRLRLVLTYGIPKKRKINIVEK